MFDVKHFQKFKARLVADGHLMKEPNETVYSVVVSLRNLRLAMLLAELNNLQMWGSDVGNAYLRAHIKEKLYIVAGPEFEELQGHVLVMYKALYGTRSGGACWHDKVFDILQQIDFKPSTADTDIWMRSSKDGSHYEYIAVYADDLAICMKNTHAFCDTQGYWITQLPSWCGYTRDEDATCVADPRIMLTRFLSPMRKCLGRSQGRPGHH